MDAFVILSTFVMGWYVGHHSSKAPQLRRRLVRIRDAVTNYQISRESLREAAQEALE